MDWNELPQIIFDAWLRLTISVLIGVTLGCLLEISGILQRFSAFSLRRDFKILPSVCTSTFLMAFVSPRSANAMLASQYSDYRISRRSTILGAVAHVFPSSTIHIRTTILIIIPLLGPVAVAYAAFQFAINFLCSLSAFVVGLVWKEEPEFSQLKTEITQITTQKNWSAFFELCKKRFLKIYSRVLLISLPLFILMALMIQKGWFDQLNTFLPDVLRPVIPAESLSIISGHFMGVINAAGLARPLLNSGSIDAWDVFKSLIIGYTVSMPLRVIRNVIPYTLGIFPSNIAISVVAWGQGLKFALACILSAILILRDIRI